MENIFGIHLYQVKSLDEYWVRLEKNLEFQLPFLKSKHEYGTSYMCSEYGIQLALVHSAKRIAEKQKIDVHKAACICMAAGLCFPPCGSCGMAACEKYIKDHAIPWSINDIKIGAIEYGIRDAGSAITPELDEALRAYYENDTSIPEVNVARYCQCKLKESRAMMKNGMSATESMQSVMDEAEKSFSAERSVISADDIEIPKEVQEKVNEDLKEFTAFSGMPKGIFEYIILSGA